MTQTGRIRVGKLMEEMDAISAQVAYQYIKGTSDEKDITFVCI